MLSLTVKFGQVISIGDDTLIHVAQKSGKTVRIVIDSKKEPIKLLPIENERLK